MSNKTNLILDLAIFVAFVFIAAPQSTGNTIHEWLGTAFIAALITHLLFHWKWIVTISAEFFKKLFHQSRLDYIVDAIFLIAMTGALFTGFMISRDVLAVFGLQAPQGGPWRALHSLTSDLSLVALGIHTAFHWKWITSNWDRFVLKPAKSLFVRQSRLAPIAAKADEN